jgi:hypothetical protein
LLRLFLVVLVIFTAGLLQSRSVLCYAPVLSYSVWLKPFSPPMMLLLLQASLFKLYELTAIAAAACGAVDARLLELLAALAAEVSPGSNEHIFWARQYR